MTACSCITFYFTNSTLNTLQQKWYIASCTKKKKNCTSLTIQWLKKGQQNKTGNIFLFPTLTRRVTLDTLWWTASFRLMRDSGWGFLHKREPYLVSTSLVKKETSTGKSRYGEPLCFYLADLISISTSFGNPWRQNRVEQGLGFCLSKPSWWE